jgi:hypothetical protein
MVALRSPRRPASPAPAIESVAAPAVEPVEAPPPPDSPLLHDLESARDSVPPLAPSQEEVAQSALQTQMAALKLAEQQQREAFEAQAQIAAAMRIEKAQPKQEPAQLSEKDYEFLGARPGIQNDPTFGQSVAALAHTFQYGSDAFYKAMELKYPVSDFRRIEKQHEDEPHHHPATEEPEKPPARQRGPVTSAPVSRSEPGGSYTPSPSSVKLSATEREIARQSNMTDREYAEQKLRLQGLKKQGHYSEEH